MAQDNDFASTSNNNNTNPFNEPTMSDSTASTGQVPPTVPQIEVRVLTQQEQQAQFNENINTRKQYINWYFRARSISAVSLVVFGFLGLVSFFNSIRIESASLFGYSILILFYMLSGFLVFYRFPRTVNRERDIRENREAKASVLMTCLFLVIGSLLIVQAFGRLATGTGPMLGDGGATLVLIIVVCNVIIGTLQTIAGTKVDSFVPMKASMMSFAVALLSFVLLANSLITYYMEAMWWLDCVLNLFIAAVLVGGSIRSLISYKPQIRLWLCPPTIPAKPNVALSELDKQWVPERSTSQA
jgi:hypothetical protein